MIPIKPVFSIFLFCMVFTNTIVQAESFFRLRGYQLHPLWTEAPEKGIFKSGTTETPMETQSSKSPGWMLSYGFLGVGISSLTTTFTSENVFYKLESKWQEGALIFNGPGNTSITLGGGTMSSGTGSITKNGTNLSALK